MNEGSSLV
jgi:hypothetical protein